MTSYGFRTIGGFSFALADRWTDLCVLFYMIEMYLKYDF